ncbi:uncharacterized protein LACBIDRAFT_299801 [Laccaria bicolor S238N-H82]|uniref:Predicted protein n=1 Tax=Laccaria bicolor (strain S238N-H82 / ATCC MYA-4686) TaxID=486041 RepID=B0DFG3_LACBS|nr:uncharacterized protein LACBIDRAFT_299801 [Laccaria bicolor S238N-H82]EDR06702.1 predicted protein [Laccaria bicolor S238N-H82]|eukprot:XP_001882549.1 predicted protein [Laccaria bicolor S238N-H82]
MFVSFSLFLFTLDHILFVRASLCLVKLIFHLLNNSFLLAFIASLFWGFLYTPFSLFIAFVALSSPSSVPPFLRSTITLSFYVHLVPFLLTFPYFLPPVSSFELLTNFDQSF